MRAKRAVKSPSRRGCSISGSGTCKRGFQLPRRRNVGAAGSVQSEARASSSTFWNHSEAVVHVRQSCMMRVRGKEEVRGGEACPEPRPRPFPRCLLHVQRAQHLLPQWRVMCDVCACHASPNQGALLSGSVVRPLPPPVQPHPCLT